MARRECVSFLGAAISGAVDSTYQYGLSTRGLAIDTYTDSLEEFRTSSFWFETAKPGATTYGVCTADSASVTGA
ncbi:glucan biosynthesis protein [Shigella flexneri]